jgi:hypothetical protein
VSDAQRHYGRVVVAWGRQSKAWLAMTYACQKGCGFEELYYCAPGVEGPHREEKLYIPCPFIAGVCPMCGGHMQHVRWTQDREFDPPIMVPEGAPYFFLGKWPEQAELYRP